MSYLSSEITGKESNQESGDSLQQVWLDASLRLYYNQLVLSSSSIFVLLFTFPSLESLEIKPAQLLLLLLLQSSPKRPALASPRPFAGAGGDTGHEQIMRIIARRRRQKQRSPARALWDTGSSFGMIFSLSASFPRRSISRPCSSLHACMQAKAQSPYLNLNAWTWILKASMRFIWICSGKRRHAHGAGQARHLTRIHDA